MNLIVPNDPPDHAGISNIGEHLCVDERVPSDTAIKYFQTPRSLESAHRPVVMLHVHNGPFIEGGPNGFLVEDLITIAKHRVTKLNSAVKCPENDLAIQYLTMALSVLEDRTDRIIREKLIASRS